MAYTENEEKLSGPQLTVIIAGPAKAKKGDLVTYNAKVVGGNAPYKFNWSEPVTKTESTDVTQSDNISSLKFNASSAGTIIIRVDIVDNKGNIGSDMFMLTIE